MTTGNIGTPALKLVTTSSEVKPSDEQLFAIAEEELGSKPDPEILAQPGVRVMMIEIWMERQAELEEQKRAADKLEADQKEKERQRVLSEQANKLRERSNKRFKPGAPKGPVVFLSNEDIQKAVQNTVLEEAKKSRPDLLPDWVREKDDVAAIRGYLCGERRNIMEYMQANPAEMKFVTWATKAIADIQAEIVFVTKLGFRAFNKADLTKEGHYCPTPKYQQYILPRLKASSFYQKLTSQVGGTNTDSAKSVEKEVPVDHIAAARKRTEQLLAEEKVRLDIGGRLVKADCDEQSVVSRADRIMKKFQGTAVERLTQAAVGQGVLAKTSSDPQLCEQAMQSAALYSKAADIGTDEFAALIDERIANAHSAADKPYAVVERPLSPPTSRRSSPRLRAGLGTRRRAVRRRTRRSSRVSDQQVAKLSQQPDSQGNPLAVFRFC
ncbi:MAG: hypothetical protein WCT43_04165 [Candidatus Magasanikbacteria bacterium]